MRRHLLTAIVAGGLACGCQADVTVRIDARETGHADIHTIVRLDSDASAATRSSLTDAVSAIAIHAGVEAGQVRVHDNGATIDLAVDPATNDLGSVAGVAPADVTFDGKTCLVKVPFVKPVELEAALDTAAAEDVDPEGTRAVLGASVRLTVEVSCPGGVTSVEGVDGAAVENGVATFSAPVADWKEGMLIVSGSAQASRPWWKHPLLALAVLTCALWWVWAARRKRRQMRDIGWR